MGEFIISTNEFLVDPPDWAFPCQRVWLEYVSERPRTFISSAAPPPRRAVPQSCESLHSPPSLAAFRSCRSLSEGAGPPRPSTRARRPPDSVRLPPCAVACSRSDRVGWDWLRT